MTLHGRRRFLGAAVLTAALPGLALGQGLRTVVDGAGRRVGLPARIGRIYAAGPPAGILAFAVAPGKLMGWTQALADDARPFIPRPHADLPVYGRLTGRGNTANIEIVLKAKPDLIVDYGTIRDTYVALADRVQAQTGIPYLLLDGSFDRMAEAILQFGQLAGEEARAGMLARYARETLDDIASRIARIPESRRPRVYYGRGPQGLDTGLASSINMETIERAGARNVAAELGRGGMVQVSAEQVLRWNPDVVITIDTAFFAMARSHPLWQTLPAIRSGRFHLAPRWPFGWIDFPPSLNRMIGLRWLAHVLYPESFSEDLRPIVRDFYTRFYHQAPTDAQLERLLATAAAHE